MEHNWSSKQRLMAHGGSPRRLQLLRRLVLPDGSILRAQLPGRPTRDSLFRDPLRDAKSLLKVRILRACCWDRDLLWLLLP